MFALFASSSLFDRMRNPTVKLLYSRDGFLLHQGNLFFGDINGLFGSFGSSSLWALTHMRVSTVKYLYSRDVSWLHLRNLFY